MANASIVDLTGADRVVILNTKCAMVYPFVAPNWSDLRLGMFLSICKTADNNDMTGLTESLAAGAPTAEKRVFIGFKNNSDALANASNCFGISNLRASDPGTTPSVVADFGTGNEWIYTGFTDICIYGNTGTQEFNNFSEGLSPQLSQNHTFTNGRAVLVLLRMLRRAGNNVISKLQSVSIIDDTIRYVTTDVFSDAPSIALIRSNFRSQAWTDEAQNKTYVTVPDAVYAYWPFLNSKLRIHSICLEKFA